MVLGGEGTHSGNRSPGTEACDAWWRRNALREPKLAVRPSANCLFKGCLAPFLETFSPHATSCILACLLVQLASNPQSQSAVPLLAVALSPSSLYLASLFSLP